MFAALFPRRGQPAEAPWRLALVTVMQYMEDLSDRQAAEAVRERIGDAIRERVREAIRERIREMRGS